MAEQNDFPAPEHGLVVTHFLTVRDVRVSREFYADVFGGRVVLAENPAVVKVANTWIIMNPGGGPTPDKPDVTLTPPEPGDPVSAFLNVRVADIGAFYATARSKGAHFLTEPRIARASCAATCVTRTDTSSKSARQPVSSKASQPPSEPLKIRWPVPGDCGR
ncbi:VOC family protein [Kribbella capetownensis]|uniref:VOC family protein n=1 Tax=Kribbella capetownensis TaxID=1572659 RepID=UPI00192DC042|nr:VOC family protein [Kribbella capetownensis]